MLCRAGCGACCIAPSISSPIPGMPQGKPSGISCLQLDANGLCKLFGQEARPGVCGGFAADASICGNNKDQALKNLYLLEQLTR